MPDYQRAVPVLQVADVGASLRWYVDVFGFSAAPFPQSPPHSFAILRKDGAEIMLQCAGEQRTAVSSTEPAVPESPWAVYLRIAGTAILAVAKAVGKKADVRRGPERMFYGLVEFEVCDPDGHRVCIGGEAPAGANVKLHAEPDADC